MELNVIYEKLLSRFGAETILGLTEAQEGIRDPFITIAGKRVDAICRYCRDEPDLAFDFLQSLTALDNGEMLAGVYHLFSYVHGHTLVLKAETPRAEPSFPSTVSVWPAADWYEREAYDLFGIDFHGHPDLRRLLLPEDWEGYPMRKDWQEQPSYRGMPTTRDNPLDLLEDDGGGEVGGDAAGEATT
jgi:NADH-quinone oxidoreductase subunit C